MNRWPIWAPGRRLAPSGEAEVLERLWTTAGSRRSKGAYSFARINIYDFALLFFFFFFSRQGWANCAELCSQQPGEKQRSHGAQLKWIGLPEPAPALVPGLCPYTEVRLLESQLGDRGQNASCWVGVSVCKLPPLRLRKEWTVVPCSVKPSASTWAHWEARSYGGQRGFNFSKQVFFFFGIVTGKCVFSIAGEIWTPKVENLFPR